MKRFIPAFLFWFLTLPLWAIPAEVENISNDKYFPALLESVKTAQKSIYACLYYISYFPDQKGKVEQILNALADAVKRGVKVEVILDRGFEEAGGGDMSKKNIRAFSFLKKSGVSIFYDDIKTLTHAKYFIMDESLVILGSHNLSENALTKNREASVLIHSPEAAKSYLEEYFPIPKYSPEPVEGAIPIPRAFLRNKNLLPKMVNRKYPYVIHFAFYVLKKAWEQNSRQVKISQEEVVKDLFKGEVPVKKTKKDPVQIYMSDYLWGWKKYYPEFLVSYRRDEVTKDLTVELKFENKAGEDSLYLSKLFWEDGWEERLSNRAKFSLLYMLDRTESGRMGRYFQQQRWDAAKEYGINHSAFAYGLIELQRYNLIDKDINWEEGSTEPNGYTLNEIYKYGDFEKSLEKLKSETDAEIFKTSMEIADLVNEPSDIEAIKQITDLGKQYGVKVLQDTLEKIKPKGGLSRYRRFEYVLGIIKSKGEEK